MTEERILNTASRLIWERGYHATGVNAILEAAGATSGSFYHFFESKDDLLLRILERYRRLLDSMIFEPALRSARDPVERVFAVLDVYRHHLDRNGCALGCPIGNLAGELSDSSPAVREAIAGLFQLWRDRICELLEPARERFPEGTDIRSLATFVLTVMEGGVMQARVQRSLEPFDASVNHLRRYLQCLAHGNARKSN